jgi:sec-independent protein translocase protein TatB
VFDVGFSELVVIGIVALVVIGPKRLPEVARAAGRMAARLRRFVDEVKRDMDSELRRDELAELRKVKDQLVETRQVFEQTASSAAAALPSIQPPQAPAADYPVKALPDDRAVGDTPAATTPKRKKSAARAKTAGQTAARKPKPTAKKAPTASRRKHD